MHDEGKTDRHAHPLEALLASGSRGSYVHIGAAHPVLASPTHALYLAGWRGINAEPLKARFQLLALHRPEDLNLHCAVGPRPGRLAFRLGEPAAAGARDDNAGAAGDPHAPSSYAMVNTVTGDSLFAQAAAPVDLLLVHADGAESEVLRSIDLRLHAPAVVGVDAGPTSDGATPPAWEAWLLKQGYRAAGSDGFDRFYLRRDLRLQVGRGSGGPGAATRPAQSPRQRVLAELEALEEAHAAQLQQLRQSHDQALARAHEALTAKERTISELARALSAYRMAHYPLSLLMPALRRGFAGLRRLREILRPRLGQLRQYAPRELWVDRRAACAKAPADAPRICLVTPSYGQGRFIEKTICSVLDQGYPALEYFVQDGGSTDGTVEVLRRYEDRLAGWTSVRDGGQSQAINLGFARGSGEVMAWLNSDDLLLPGALACVADYFARHPEVEVVYGNRLLIDEHGREIGRWILPGHDGQALRWADYIPQETLFWRRSIWERVGGRVDESFRFAMDWDLLVRFQAAGARFAHLPRFLGAFRVHDAQKTSGAIEQIGFQEMTRIRERLWGRIPGPAQIRAALTFFMFRHVVADFRFRLRTRIGLNP